MDEEFCRLLAKRTVAEMDRAFDCFYPVEGNNDIPEAITATYLAFQLRDHGFLVYPQIQCSGQIDNHLDSAAIHPANRLVLLVEAKRIYSSEKARSLGDDWRLQTAGITSEFRHIPPDYRHVACLLATTWNESFREWWVDPARPLAPTRQRNTEDWVDLKHGLDYAFVNLAVNVSLSRLAWELKLHLLFSFVQLSAGTSPPTVFRS